MYTSSVKSTEYKTLYECGVTYSDVVRLSVDSSGRLRCLYIRAQEEGEMNGYRIEDRYINDLKNELINQFQIQGSQRKKN